MSSKVKITSISDTHSRHENCTKDLIPGDIITHSGDFMTTGYKYDEILDFVRWYGSLDYKYKFVIAGNHDRLLDENFSDHFTIADIHQLFTDHGIIYLQDTSYIIEEYNNLTVYGTPWQPEFHAWAFNLPRAGKELAEVWSKIPRNVDILITHTPPYGILDREERMGLNCGCTMLDLELRLNGLKPKIHVFGHIHEAFGYVEKHNCHFMNVSILNRRYEYRKYSVNYIFDYLTNTISHY